MVTIYFWRGNSTPILRYWPCSPQVGDSVALPEWGDKPLKVYNVLWEGDDDDPRVTVHLHRASAKRKRRVTLSADSDHVGS